MRNPRHDEADEFLTCTARISSRDEYRHLLCYGGSTSAANEALEIAMETIRSVTSTPVEKACAYSLVDAATRTHQALPAAGEARLTCILRFKAKKILTGEARVSERLVYSRCFESISSERGSNVVDGLMPTLEEKRLEVSITAIAIAQVVAHFNAGETYRTSPTTSMISRIITRPSLRTAQEAGPSPLPTRHTIRQRPTRRNDGVARLADSCTAESSYMRHHVR
jgi:hypothetical protein